MNNLKMKRLLMLLCMLILVWANAPVSYGENGQKTKRITVPFELEKEKQLQSEVDKGHQPWRLEPLDVAHVALLANIHIEVPVERCALSSVANREAVVKCKDSKNYTLRLKQLIRPKGIWTATEIQVVE